MRVASVKRLQLVQPTVVTAINQFSPCSIQLGEDYLVPVPRKGLQWMSHRWYRCTEACSYLGLLRK